MLAIVFTLPGAFERWILAKELVFLCAVLIACSAPAAGRVPRVVWGLIAAGGLVLAVAALASAQPLTALFGRWPRYEGLVSLPVMVAAVWLGARLLGPGAGSERGAVWARAVSLASLAVAAVGALEAAGLRPIVSDLARPGSLLGNASDQGIAGAVFTAVLLPAVLSAVAERGGRAAGGGIDRAPWATLLIWSGACGGVLSVALSGSRAGMLALLAGVLCAAACWALPRWADRRREALRGAAFAGAAVVVSAAVVLLLPSARDRLLGASGYAASTVTDRLLIWSETLGIVRDHPWLGVGPGGYVDAIAREHGPEWFAAVTPGTVLDSPHNWPLQALVAGGIPLLLIAVALLATVAVLGIRRLLAEGSGPLSGWIDAGSERVPNRSGLVAGSLGGLAAVCIGWSTHFPMPSTGLLAGLLLGISCAEPVRRGASRGWRRARALLAAVWLLLFGVVVAAEYPLAAGVAASSAEDADRAFAAAAALRPWDGEVASIAAQTFAAHANAGAVGAGEYGAAWADRALELIPHSAAARTALGISLRAQGDLPGAAEALSAVLEAQPNDPRAMAQLGVTLMIAGDTGRGSALIERAASLAGDDPAVASAREWASRASG